MATYDIIFGSSTYHSYNRAIQMLRSSRYLGGRILHIVSGTNKDELAEIEHQCCNTSTEYILFLSAKNNMWFNINWAFIWGICNGVTGRYFSTLDDDIEFTEASNIVIQELDIAWAKHKFSVMTFSTNYHNYGRFGCQSEDGPFRMNVDWFNGDSVMTRWKNNRKYGLCDTPLDTHMAYYGEMEFTHRMRFLTGKPSICYGIPTYLHHFREDSDRTQERSDACFRAISAGKELWEKKYHIEVPDVVGGYPGVYEDIYRMTMKESNRQAIETSYAYGMKWTHWKRIYDSISSQFTLISDRRRE